MRFYDELGWKKSEGDIFYDAWLNEDRREVSRYYIRECHLRVNKHLPPRGEYILDIASGPVQYDEYLTYSANFTMRICCDISFEALRAAKRRIGGRGIYIQCDITNIPLMDGVVDAFVSLHTVYHVPESKQIEAFRELARVTRDGGSGVVVYTWGNDAWGMKLFAPLRGALRSKVHVIRSTVRGVLPYAMVQWVRRKCLRPTKNRGSAGVPVPAASQFCFHAHDYRWYRQNIASGGWTLHCWRSLSVGFLKRYIREGTLGRWFLGFVFWFENIFPGILGRVGQYPMFAFRKTPRSAEG